MIRFLQLHPQVLVLVLLAALAGGFAWGIHWWVLDVRDWFRWANHPVDLPGQPQSMPAPLAGEHHPTADEWEQLDPDEAADVWVAELHDEPEPCARCGQAFTLSQDDGAYCWNCDRYLIEQRRELDWRDDPDLVVWDAKRQAARCWEILHVEFPRLRAELCGAAAA